jgi:metal transporter CNNM
MASTLLSSPRFNHGGSASSSSLAHLQWIRLTRVLGPLLFALTSIPLSYAAPLLRANEDDDVEPKPAADPSLWIYLGTAVALVLLGGVFAGLTIAYVDFPSRCMHRAGH